MIPDKNGDLLGATSQDIMFTPSPEIVTTVLRQIDNNSYQSTPLVTHRDSGTDHKHKIDKTRTIHSRSRFSNYEQKLGQENAHVDYSSQELFSENSCDLFSTSCCDRTNAEVRRQILSTSRISSQNVIDKSACAGTTKLSQGWKMRVSPGIHEEIEMFSTNSEELFSNSEELFSNGSLTGYYGDDENICKKLF